MEKCAYRGIIKGNGQKNKPAESPAAADIQTAESQISRRCQQRIGEVFEKGLQRRNAFFRHAGRIVYTNFRPVYMDFFAVVIFNMDARAVNIDFVAVFCIDVDSVLKRNGIFRIFCRPAGILFRIPVFLSGVFFRSLVLPGAAVFLRLFRLFPAQNQFVQRNIVGFGQ